MGRDGTRCDENDLTGNRIEESIIIDTNDYETFSAATDLGVQGGRLPKAITFAGIAGCIDLFAVTSESTSYCPPAISDEV